MFECMYIVMHTECVNCMHDNLDFHTRFLMSKHTWPSELKTRRLPSFCKTRRCGESGFRNIRRRPANQSSYGVSQNPTGCRQHPAAGDRITTVEGETYWDLCLMLTPKKLQLHPPMDT